MRPRGEPRFPPVNCEPEPPFLCLRPPRVILARRRFLRGSADLGFGVMNAGMGRAPADPVITFCVDLVLSVRPGGSLPISLLSFCFVGASLCARVL